MPAGTKAQLVELEERRIRFPVSLSRLQISDLLILLYSTHIRTYAHIVNMCLEVHHDAGLHNTRKKLQKYPGSGIN